jgi:hypothetical protein
MTDVRRIPVTLLFAIAAHLAAATGVSADDGPKAVWSVTDATALALDKPHVENYATGTFQLRPKDDTRLYLVRCQVKPLVADDRAVERLADRRKQLADNVSNKSPSGAAVKDRVALSAAESAALTGKYRFFAMELLVVTDDKGKKRRPVWGTLPPAKLTLYGAPAALTGHAAAGREPAGWGGTLRAESVFVGVLEVGKTSPVAFLYGLPKDVKLDELKVSLEGGEPVPVTVAKKK